MAAADFCTVTTCIAASRAARMDDVAASFFDTQRAARHGAGSWYPGGTLSGYRRHPLAPHAVQISPGKNANFLCTSAAFTLSVEPVGFAVMCQLASALWAFYAVSVRRLAHLHSGFLQTHPRGYALAVG